MTNVKRIFDVFSKRPGASAKPKHDIPQTTRNRVVIWCGELYSNSRSELPSTGNYNPEFWQEIYRRLLFRTGSLRLSQSDERVVHDSGRPPSAELLRRRISGFS